MRQGDGTDGGPVKRWARRHAPVHWIGGETRPARRPRRPGWRLADPDQGGLAAAGPGAPPGPDRRRPGGVARGDATDGRDQRRLRGAHPHRRVHPGPRRRCSVHCLVRRPAGRSSATEALASDHRPAGHERHVSPAQPGRREPVASRAAGRPGARCGAVSWIASRRARRRRPGRRSRAGSVTSGGRPRPRSTRRPATSSNSASSMGTAWARSPPSSRPTSIGWPARSHATPISWRPPGSSAATWTGVASAGDLARPRSAPAVRPDA